MDRGFPTMERSSDEIVYDVLGEISPSPRGTGQVPAKCQRYLYENKHD
jgi:hypothetical protein